MGKDFFILNDGLSDDVIVNVAIIQSHFKLPYSQTCYSLQGLDIDEPFTIFDINHHYVDIQWIYTAITRATEIKNIQLFLSNVKNETDDGKINNMIQSHKRSDEKRKMPMTNYIDVKWVQNELKKNKYVLLLQRRN